MTAYQIFEFWYLKEKKALTKLSSFLKKCVIYIIRYKVGKAFPHQSGYPDTTDCLGRIQCTCTFLSTK